MSARYPCASAARSCGVGGGPHGAAGLSGDTFDDAGQDGPGARIVDAVCQATCPSGRMRAAPCSPRPYKRDKDPCGSASPAPIWNAPKGAPALASEARAAVQGAPRRPASNVSWPSNRSRVDIRRTPVSIQACGARIPGVVTCPTGPAVVGAPSSAMMAARGIPNAEVLGAQLRESSCSISHDRRALAAPMGRRSSSSESSSAPGPSPKHPGELPGEVVRGGDAGVHAQGAAGSGAGGRVTDEEGRADSVAARDLCAHQPWEQPGDL